MWGGWDNQGHMAVGVGMAALRITGFAFWNVDVYTKFTCYFGISIFRQKDYFYLGCCSFSDILGAIDATALSKILW